MYELELSNYNIKYYIDLPSKASDYDYDDGKRFISTFMHKLIFCDKITNFKNITMRFSTEVCCKIAYGLEMLVSNNMKKRPLLITIKDIFVNDKMFPSIITLCRFENGNIQISILDLDDKEYVLLNNDDIEKIINLLKNDIWKGEKNE